MRDSHEPRSFNAAYVGRPEHPQSKRKPSTLAPHVQGEIREWRQNNSGTSQVRRISLEA